MIGYTHLNFMANEEQLKVLRLGSEAWNEWRRENPDEEIDLRGASLRGADLSKANLSKADLFAANLSKANLSKADLSGANLSGAVLSLANLSGADLREADLSLANLSGANLSKADLSGANLSLANLRDAYLREADLSGADLSKANLSKANLRRALIGFRALDIWNVTDLQTFANSTASMYTALFALQFKTDTKGLEDEQQIKIHRIRIGSPGGYSLIGIPEVIKELKEIIIYLWHGHKIDELDTKKKCLELLDKWFEMRIKYYDELRDVELLSELCKGVIDLRKLEAKGKLANIPLNLEYSPEQTYDEKE
jgi:hypothetical protein